VTLAWAAARDDVRVRRYVVWQQVGRRWRVVARPAGTRVVVRRLRAGSTHRFQVQALDAAGNASKRSGTLLARTRAK
jgi:chitin-binding protein